MHRSTEYGILRMSLQHSSQSHLPILPLLRTMKAKMEGTAWLWYQWSYLPSLMLGGFPFAYLWLLDR